MQPNTTCQHCGKAFYVKPHKLREGNGKYCGRACYDAARNADNPTLTCGWCEQEFKLPPCRKATSNNTRFCSHECYQAHKQDNVRSPEDRFWEKVKIGSPNECWEWQGAKDYKGYGRLGFKGGWIAAHRYSMRLHLQRDTSRLVVCHACDNPGCVNPAHLYVGSQSENMREMHAKGRGGRAKLTPTQVADLRAERAKGATYRRLAAEFGVSISQAYNICSGRCWN